VTVQVAQRPEVAPGLTPDSIQQKYAQTVVSTRIVPGCVQFLGAEKRFYTVWVIRVDIAMSALSSAIHDSGWTRKKFASWGRKACSCERSSPPQAQKRRVLACPVLYRSGAPDTIRTCDLCLRRAAVRIADDLLVTAYVRAAFISGGQAQRVAKALRNRSAFRHVMHKRRRYMSFPRVELDNINQPDDRRLKPARLP
jgi:hypothetical protein